MVYSYKSAYGLNLKLFLYDYTCIRSESNNETFSLECLLIVNELNLIYFSILSLQDVPKVPAKVKYR